MPTCLKVTFTRLQTFRDASLKGADLSDADFTDADMDDADFDGADLEDTEFDGADLSGAKNLRKAKKHPRRRLQGHGMSRPGHSDHPTMISDSCWPGPCRPFKLGCPE